MSNVLPLLDFLFSLVTYINCANCRPNNTAIMFTHVHYIQLLYEASLIQLNAKLRIVNSHYHTIPHTLCAISIYLTQYSVNALNFKQHIAFDLNDIVSFRVAFLLSMSCYANPNFRRNNFTGHFTCK